MDPFILVKLAVHADLNIPYGMSTLNDDDVRAAMEKGRGAKRWAYFWA
jgi:hypothetical protein